VNSTEEHIDKKVYYKEEYLLYLLRNGEPPVTVYRFCEDLGQSESDFYKYFSSFAAIEKDIWKSYFSDVRETLENDENYPEYSAYEKWLSFLYTTIELFKQNRSFVVLKCKALEIKQIRPAQLEAFKKEFNILSSEIINSGLSSDEIATRPVITSKYNEVLWVQFLYILRVWINDESEDFQITDAAVEKTSVLLFELMKRGPIDMLIDFVKFAYQNKAY
jgi:hypothetical protein